MYTMYASVTNFWSNMFTQMNNILEKDIAEIFFLLRRAFKWTLCERKI